MIDLNVTLLFQAFHFAIAYVLLSKMLFNPALKAIYAHEHALHDAIAHLKSLRTTIDRTDQEQASFLARVRSYFAHHTPQTQRTSVASQPSEQQNAPADLSAPLKQETQKKLTHLFVSSWDSHDI